MPGYHLACSPEFNRQFLVRNAGLAGFFHVDQRSRQPGIDGGKSELVNPLNDTCQARRESVEHEFPKSPRAVQCLLEIRIRNGGRNDVRFGYGFCGIVFLAQEAGRRENAGTARSDPVKRDFAS